VAEEREFGSNLARFGFFATYRDRAHYMDDLLAGT
jgi:hypothetical protein